MNTARSCLFGTNKIDVRLWSSFEGPALPPTLARKGPALPPTLARNGPALPPHGSFMLRLPYPMLMLVVTHNRSACLCSGCFDLQPTASSCCHPLFCACILSCLGPHIREVLNSNASLQLVADVHPTQHCTLDGSPFTAR